uniref:Uncharacterized protein n=1 Tax=viral metagenome TaxID=1070528 RepID=A0A6M3M1D1_9ZZZZ
MERYSMSLLGLAVTKAEKGEGTIYVEYHKCEKCGVEYRVYMRSPEDVEEAFQTIAKRLGNKKEETDLCFNCQRGVIADQPMLPLGI